MTMPAPIAICLEDLDATSEGRRYLQCTAVAGGTPGLVLDEGGQAKWCAAGGVELWVSADDCLILFRAEDAVPVTVHRVGRSLEVPAERPVVLLDQDSIDVADRRLRIHVHGIAPAVAPPTWLPPAEPASPTLNRAAAAAMAVGVAVAGAGCEDQQSDQPSPDPAVSTVAETASAEPSASAASAASATAEPSSTASAEATASASAAASTTAAPAVTKTAPIQVRVRPPKPMRPPKDPNAKGF